MNTSKEAKKRHQYQKNNSKKSKKLWIILGSLFGGAAILAGTGVGIWSCYNSAKQITVAYSSDHYYFNQYDHAFIGAPVIETPDNKDITNLKFTDIDGALAKADLTLRQDGSIACTYLTLAPFGALTVKIQVEGDVGGKHYEAKTTIEITCDDINTIFNNDNCLSPNDEEWPLMFTCKGSFIESYNFSALADTEYTSIDFGSYYFDAPLFSMSPPKEFCYGGQIKGIKFGDATTGQTGQRLIPSRSFQGCDGINLVYLPSSLTAVAIDEYAFCECTNLYGFVGDNLNVKHSGATISSITNSRGTFPAIGTNAFYDCGSLHSDLISNLNYNPADLQYVENVESSSNRLLGAGLVAANGKDWIEGAGLIADDIGAQLNSISFSNIPDRGISLFHGCASLGTMNLTSNTSLKSESLRTGDFLGCHSLYNIKLPSAYSDLSGNAFSDCYSLMSLNSDDDDLVDLSNFVKIYGESFKNDTNIHNIKFSKDLLTIYPDAFNNVSNLQNIYIDASSAPVTGAQLNISDLNSLHGNIAYLGTLDNAKRWQKAFGLTDWVLVENKNF